MMPLAVSSLAFSYIRPTMTLLYHLLILLMIVILVSMFVRFGPLVGMGFHIHLEILDTILQLFLMGFVILNEWYPTMVYLYVWLGLFLLVDNNGLYFLPPFF